MSKRVILYARVSTDGQAKKGYSLPTQLAAMRAYAQSQGFEIAEELTDDCSGTIPFYERPAGKRIFELVSKDSICAVVLYTHDRTARDDQVIEYLLFKTYLYEQGLELHYADAGKDPNTMEANLVGYIKAHGAAEERRKIRERNMRGKQAKIEAGKWLGTGGSMPYGYDRVGANRDAAMMVNPEESAIVRRIFDLYIGVGGREPLPMRTIARILTEEGVPTQRGGRGWYSAIIRRMLRNQTYAGRLWQSGICTEAPELAIIDPETWVVAQERTEKNKIYSRRNAKHDYLLSGHLRCTCESAMGGFNREGRWVYYRCVNRLNYGYLISCREPYFNASKADALVWEWVSGLIKDKQALAHGIRRMKERERAELEPKRERLESVKQLTAKAESKIKRLAASLGETEDEYTAEAIKGELKTAQKQRQALLTEAKQLEAELSQETLTPEDEAEINRIADLLREKIDGATFAQKRFVLDRLGFRAHLRHDEAGRWLDCTCTVTIQSVSLSIEQSPLKRLIPNSTERVVCFSAALPLDGQTAPALAEVLFSRVGVPVAAP